MYYHKLCLIYFDQLQQARAQFLYLYRFLMEQYQSKAIDRCILNLMNKIYNETAKDKDQNDHQCLILEQRIIYATFIYLSSTSTKESDIQDMKSKLKDQIVNFVQRINKTTMENYEKDANNKSKIHEKMINKSISLLMVPGIEKFIEDTLLYKLKILNFNNISCIYKKTKKFGIAIRAIDYALQLEEKLLLKNNQEEKYEIVPTYLNKAAILSQTKKHRESIDIILKAKIHIEKIEGELTRQIEQSIDEKQKKRLIEKRYYGLYMKMIILYNMGAEKQHLHLPRQALEYYKQSKHVATIIGNQLMIKKLQNVIFGLAGQG